MKVIKKKIKPQFFLAVTSCLKSFEIRKDEDDVQVGDILALREWENGEYTGQMVFREITYVLRNAPEYGLKEGYAIYGIAPIKNLTQITKVARKLKEQEEKAWALKEKHQSRK